MEIATVELLNHAFTLSFMPRSPSLIKEFPATFSNINLFMAYWLMVLGWDLLSKKKESWALKPAAASCQFPHPSTCSHQPPWMCSPPDTNWIKQQSLNGKAAFAIRLRDRFHLLAYMMSLKQQCRDTPSPADLLTSYLASSLNDDSCKNSSLSCMGQPVSLSAPHLKQPFPGDLLTSFFHRNNDHWNMGREHAIFNLYNSVGWFSRKCLQVSVKQPGTHYQGNHAPP